MRLTYDIRLAQRPEFFFCFELPMASEMEAGWLFDSSEIENVVRAAFDESLAPAGISVQSVRARQASVDVLVELLRAPIPMAWDTGWFAGEETLRLLVPTAVIGSATALWGRWRSRIAGRILRPAAEAPGQPSFSGDLLATARRVAATEASLRGCTAALAGDPVIQQGGYQAMFRTAGDGGRGDLLAVTVRYDGKGYDLRWRTRGAAVHTGVIH